MLPSENGISAPWIRMQLIEWLVKLSDRSWQKDNWGHVGRSGQALDEALDFFDDSGVLDDPQGSVGFALIGDDEVAAMSTLNAALDRAISISASSDAEIISDPRWEDVVVAAFEALAVMRN